MGGTGAIPTLLRLLARASTAERLRAAEAGGALDGSGARTLTDVASVRSGLSELKDGVKPADEVGWKFASPLSAARCSMEHIVEK